MCVVSCPFQTTGNPTVVIATKNISHTSSKSYSITCHDTFGRSLIGHDNTIELIATFIEIKCAQIDPCAASHSLVDCKFCNLPLVKNEIFSILYTFRQSLITYIDSIFTSIRNIWLIADFTEILLFSGFSLSDGTVSKRVFPIIVECLYSSKSRFLSCFPFFPIYRFFVVISFDRIIIINYDFLFLPISFTRSENNGTGILKHRNQIRDNDGLREQILGSTKEIWSLPFPAFLIIIIISAMRCPY